MIRKQVFTEPIMLVWGTEQHRAWTSQISPPVEHHLNTSLYDVAIGASPKTTPRWRALGARRWGRERYET